MYLNSKLSCKPTSNRAGHTNQVVLKFLGCQRNKGFQVGRLNDLQKGVFHLTRGHSLLWVNCSAIEAPSIVPHLEWLVFQQLHRLCLYMPPPSIELGRHEAAVGLIPHAFDDSLSLVRRE